MMFKTQIISNFLYMFVTSSAIFVKIEICAVKFIHSININVTFGVIFMILDVHVSSVLSGLALSLEY
jgi:hypothetical protein